MPRNPRQIVPGQPQHVIQRGNNRAVTFPVHDDYAFYRESVTKACNASGCSVHAYVLMPNHVHLLLTPDTTSSIPRMMQSVGRRYVKYVNHKYSRTGTLWEGRYRSALIDTDHYLLACHRYIELNPVRAALANRPEDYPWSSYRAHAYGEPDELVQNHSLYLSLGSTDAAREVGYRDLFRTELEERTLELIRRSTHHRPPSCPKCEVAGQPCTHWTGFTLSALSGVQRQERSSE
jgi:putative transposase